VRDPYSVTWFDYDLSAGVSLPGFLSGQSTDFDNHGDSFPSTKGANVADFVDVNFGATLQFGGLGFAATGDLEQFSLTNNQARIGRWKVLGAYGFFDGQLVLGGGVRVLTMQLLQNAGPTLLTMTGAAPEVGALYMPTGFQWRLGAAARAAVSGGPFGGQNVTTEGGVEKAGTFVLPQAIALPWEVEVGGAYQLGPRPLNPGWENPHDQEAWMRRRIADQRAERALLNDAELAALPPDDRARRANELMDEESRVRAEEERELATLAKQLYDQRKARYENWPREKILLLASVLFSGPTSDAVSLQSFLSQQVLTAGRKMTVTPRLGMEGEPLRDRITVRVGTYVEPSRYEQGSPRQHFTFGGDVRLFPIDFWGLLPAANWKLAFMLDLAPRYENYGIGIGNWH
jgi:hypothetical protein